MSRRLLNVYANENPDFQKQMGCMTGIFQMFNRHHLHKGRQLIGHNHRKVTSDHALLNNAGSGGERNLRSTQILLEKNLSKSLSKKPQASVSSSTSSSFSSLDCNASTHQEASCFNETSVSERSPVNSPRLRNSESNSRPIHCQPCHELSNVSVKSGGQSLDFRDLVKDSMYRDTPALSVKTSTKEEVKNILKHRYSPRTMQMDGAYVIGVDGNLRTPDHQNVSPRVLVKLKETPWNSMEPPRTYQAKNASFHPRGSPRFSCDGREILRSSMDAQENIKSGTKLRFLPRLSLDSRQGSSRSSELNSKANSLLEDLDRNDINERVSTSVVVKLMGLEAMPSLKPVSQEPTSMVRTNSKKGTDPLNGQKSMSSKSPRLGQGSQQDRLSHSPKSSFNDSYTPKLNKHDSDLKPKSSSRIHIEAVPWRQHDTVHIPKKARQTEVAYNEIEKRLKELEFQHPNRDLRALKQILDVMHAKGLLETKRGKDQRIKVSSKRNQINQTPTGSEQKKTHGSKTQKVFESPIVAMKPRKSISGLAVEDRLPSLRRHQTNDTMDGKKASMSSRMIKDQTHKTVLEASNNFSFPTTDKKSKENSLQKTRLQRVQASLVPQQLTRENNGSSVKMPSSLSPRRQQRKLELEKKLNNHVSSSDSEKIRSQSANKQSLDSVSPRGKLQRKPAQVECSTRNVDEMFQRSDSNMNLASQLDVELTREQCNRSPSGRAAINAASRPEKKKSLLNLKDVSTIDLAIAVPEQPSSPISTFDASFYKDDMPPSPMKETSNASKDDDTRVSDKYWVPMDTSDRPPSKLSSEINGTKLEDSDDLVQNHGKLMPTNDEPQITEQIASLCETQYPDHQYISEILVASGLLLKDLTFEPMSSMALQLHPIKPDLFLVLEQTKPSSLSKPDPKKLHRKLVFDLVNEILVQKFNLTSQSPHPGLLLQTTKLKDFPSGQRVLKELCSEIKLLQAERLKGNSFDDENLISSEHLRRSKWLEDIASEVHGIVVEVETSMFKDLVDEIVDGEPASCLQRKPTRRRRQLFEKKY